MSPKGLPLFLYHASFYPTLVFIKLTVDIFKSALHSWPELWNVLIKENQLSMNVSNEHSPECRPSRVFFPISPITREMYCELVQFFLTITVVFEALSNVLSVTQLDEQNLELSAQSHGQLPDLIDSATLIKENRA